MHKTYSRTKELHLQNFMEFEATVEECIHVKQTQDGKEAIEVTQRKGKTNKSNIYQTTLRPHRRIERTKQTT